MGIGGTGDALRARRRPSGNGSVVNMVTHRNAALRRVSHSPIGLESHVSSVDVRSMRLLRAP